MASFDSRFTKYLATGDYESAQDSAPVPAVAPAKKHDDLSPEAVVAQDAAEKYLALDADPGDLAAHDRRFHPNGYDPKRDSCSLRDDLNKDDKEDTLPPKDNPDFTRSQANLKKVKDAFKGTSYENADIQESAQDDYGTLYVCATGHSTDPRYLGKERAQLNAYVHKDSGKVEFAATDNLGSGIGEIEDSAQKAIKNFEDFCKRFKYDIRKGGQGEKSAPTSADKVLSETAIEPLNADSDWAVKVYPRDSDEWVSWRFNGSAKRGEAGETLYQVEYTHKNGKKILGGWVSPDAKIGGNARVMEDAEVHGHAEVSGNAVVYGSAKIYGTARISGNAAVRSSAVVSDNARVSDNAVVSGHARVSDNAQVYGQATVDENARVSAGAQVFDKAKVSGNAMVGGDAEIYEGAQVSGNARVSGNAKVRGEAWVREDAKVSDNAKIGGEAEIFGCARVYGHADVHGTARIYDFAKVYGTANISANTVEYDTEIGG